MDSSGLQGTWHWLKDETAATWKCSLGGGTSLGGGVIMAKHVEGSEGRAWTETAHEHSDSVTRKGTAGGDDKQGVLVLSGHPLLSL